MTSDTSTDAVVKLSKEISALASREAQTMPTGWQDAYWLYAKTADAMLALAAERDALRAKLDEARNQAPMNVMTSKLFADLNILLAQHAEMGARVQMLEAENAALRGGGISDIAGERKRQIEAEGWTPEHDDEHTGGELAKAAGCYAWAAAQSDGLREILVTPPPTWPEEWAADWWKLKDRRSDLVRAGALIAAEIERLDRAASKGRP
ncbi:hypothetical protein [Ponticoccus sp. (in: a-proteobacteria)]|uniref:hypothetical protein n=1 Tax=Ponticoccus sp. (in: a-proteobacteria) TaxID=1925025 RepID=UPI003AB337D5